MRIAVLSDSHDNIWNLDAALELMDDAETFIHCGDLCSPFVVKHLAEFAHGRPLHIVWGNNDGDPRLICQIASQYSGVRLHGQLAQLNLDGMRVAVNHYPEIAQPIAASGSFDLVCYGHDHTAHESLVNDCILLNPGELLGMMGKATFAWFDTQTRICEFVEVQKGTRS